ncbi:hypothetical protein TNCV_221811 [Trichonephila clavipes]|nr:hypothetical protein TNCV_221811 [Trichonephila clavipes]
MGLPRNIAIELRVQHCPECPHTSQSSCFQSQELTDPGQTTRNTPHHYAFTTKLNSRNNAVTKETSTGHPPNPDASIRLPDCKARFITPTNSFPHVLSPMTVSSTPLRAAVAQWLRHPTMAGMSCVRSQYH